MLLSTLPQEVVVAIEGYPEQPGLQLLRLNTFEIQN
jgi:hypothetical protein